MSERCFTCGEFSLHLLLYPVNLLRYPDNRFLGFVAQPCDLLSGQTVGGLFRFGLAHHQIDAKLVSERDDVAPGMTIAFGKLGHQLLDAGGRHGNHPFLLTLLERYLLAERTLKQQLEVRCHRRRLALGALRIATLSRLELKFLRRTTRADLVLRLRYRRSRSTGTIGTEPVGFLRHMRSRWLISVRGVRRRLTWPRAGPRSSRRLFLTQQG